MSDTLDLVDYRRRVAESYARVRAAGAGEEAWLAWREDRDGLFRTHPQTPLDDTGAFRPLPYFPYDRRWRVPAEFVTGDDATTDVEHSDRSDNTLFRIAGRLRFDLEGQTHSLAALWLEAYGGGLFVPFRDATNGTATYGGGRYLLDTVKGADLGSEGDRVILDFNYAYHPSCVYSPKWSCPLSPPSNTLGVEVTAGERLP